MNCRICKLKGKTVPMVNGKAIVSVDHAADFGQCVRKNWHTEADLPVANVLKCPECGYSVSK